MWLPQYKLRATNNTEEHWYGRIEEVAMGALRYYGFLRNVMASEMCVLPDLTFKSEQIYLTDKRKYVLLMSYLRPRYARDLLQ